MSDAQPFVRHRWFHGTAGHLERREAGKPGPAPFSGGCRDLNVRPDAVAAMGSLQELRD